MTSDRIVNETHPTSVEIDRLRAGWLDDAPETKRAQLAHLASCAQCQHDTARWRELIEQAVAGPLEPGLSTELKLRRRLALNGHAATRHTLSQGLRSAMAIAAMLAVTVVGLGALYYAGSPTPPDQFAISEPDDSDLYADFDFYLWLLENNGAETGDASKG